MACRHRAANEKFNLLFVLSSWSAVLLSQFYSGNGGGAGCWRLHLQCQSALLRSNKWMFPPNRVQQVSALCIRPVCYCEFGWSLASLFFFFFFYLPAFKIINSDILRQTFPPSLHTHTHTHRCGDDAGLIDRSVLTASCCPGWPSSRLTKTGVVSGTGWWVGACCGRRWTGCAPTLAWAPLLIRRYGGKKHCVSDNHTCRCFTQPRLTAHTPLTAVLKAANEALKSMYANNYTHMTL